MLSLPRQRHAFDYFLRFSRYAAILRNLPRLFGALLIRHVDVSLQPPGARRCRRYAFRAVSFADAFAADAATPLHYR